LQCRCTCPSTYLQCRCITFVMYMCLAVIRLSSSTSCDPTHPVMLQPTHTQKVHTFVRAKFAHTQPRIKTTWHVVFVIVQTWRVTWRVIVQTARTPLHYAFSNGQHQTARLLLDANADVDARDTVSMCVLYIGVCECARHGKHACGSVRAWLVVGGWGCLGCTVHIYVYAALPHTAPHYYTL